MPELTTMDERKDQLQSDLVAIKNKVSMAIPPQLKPRIPAFMMGAIQCGMSNPTTLKVMVENPAITEMCVLEAASMGLMLGPTMGADAHIIPRKIKGRLIPQLQPNYRGLYKLTKNAGTAVVRCGVVHKLEAESTEHFDYDEGSNAFVKYKRILSGERGPIVGAWAEAKVVDGGESTVEIMSVEELERIREKSPGADQAAWRDNKSEMYRKTVQLRIMKRLPRSPEMARLMDMDNAVMAGKEQPLRQPADIIAETETVEPPLPANDSETSPQPSRRASTPQGGGGTTSTDDAMNDQQRKYMMSLAKEIGLAEEDRHTLSQKLVGKSSSKDFTKGDATKVITALSEGLGHCMAIIEESES